MGKTLKECYEVLGLDSSATEDEIKSAYRQKALKCHPDKNPDDPLSTQKFQELGHAYRRLMGEEDSDDDDENDYDSRDNMELWRDFFYFLFREEIIAKARCQCYTCRRHGDEDDDFLASLVKNQEKEQQFTEEEMAQFTSFANLKEQKEANKQKFCNKNLSSSKPEQRTNKGHKPKLKSNRELKREQWKREQEITEIAAQIKQTSIVQEKTSSKASKNIDLQEKRPLQHVDVDPKHSAKEHTGAANKRNTRKKRNRNKSKMQDNQETDTRQKNGHRDTTSFTEQKMSSTLVIKDVMGNVAIKPETTRRQDDVTGRLPHHTSFSSRRMMQSSGANAAFRSQKSTFHKQTGKGWFENPGPQVSSTSSYDANIWEKRQQKQQFLAELQPSNQADEELQFQMALELSKKQAEIDAQQRKISVLEKEMEETLQIEKEFELKSVQNKSRSSTASNAETNTIAAIFDDEFPPLVYEQGPDGEEEWMVASGSEDEWGDYTCGNDGDESEACLTEFSDSREEHTVKLPAQDSEITERDNKTVSTTHVQLPQNPRNQNAKALDCPYGKNCCLGKRCKYSHSSTIDTGSRSKSVDNSFSQDQKSLGKSGRNADSHLVHNIAGNLASDDITFGASYEELPMSDNSDIGPSTGNNGTSSTGGSIIIIANHSIQDLPKEACAPLISKASNKTADQYSRQANAASGSYTGEDFKCTSNVSGENAVTEDQMGVPGEEGKPSSPLPLRTLNQPITSVVQVSNLSCSSGTMNQSADSMPQLTILPASCSDLKEPPNSMPQLSNLTVDASAQNYSPQVPLAAVSSTVTPPATASGTQGSDYTSTIPGTLSVTSKNATSTSEAHIVQTSSTSQQPNTPIASLSTSPLTVNSFPAVPAGFPLLPFGNLSPILNPTNATSFSPTLSTTQMAARGLHGITLAAVRPPCNGVQNPQGLMAPPYYTNQPNCSGLPAAGQYIPMSPLNGFPGLKATDLQRGHDSAKVTGFASSQPPPPPGIPQITGLRGMPRTCKPPSLQAGFATNPLSTAQARVQLKGFVGLPFGADMLQFSQAGLSTAQPTPLSVPQLLLNGVSGIPVGANMPAVVTNPQLIRYPFSMINPQVSVNMETEMASKGIPQSIPQDSRQTEKSATLQVQGSKEQKPAEVRSDTGQQKQGPSDGGTKAPLLRRPATMPKVIQHQVST